MVLGGAVGGGHPCESSTVLETEAWFISSQIKAAEVGWMEKIIPTEQKQKMLIPPSKHRHGLLFQRPTVWFWFCSPGLPG